MNKMSVCACEGEFHKTTFFYIYTLRHSERDVILFAEIYGKYGM